MTREELIAIISGILQAGLALQPEQKLDVPIEKTVIAIVDRATLLVEESFKPTEQRADEAIARAVAERLNDEARNDAKMGAAASLAREEYDRVYTQALKRFARKEAQQASPPLGWPSPRPEF